MIFSFMISHCSGGNEAAEDTALKAKVKREDQLGDCHRCSNQMVEYEQWRQNLSRTVKGFLLILQSNKLNCHVFRNASRRQETPDSETKDFITHSHQCSQRVSFYVGAQSPSFHQTMQSGLGDGCINSLQYGNSICLKTENVIAQHCQQSCPCLKCCQCVYHRFLVFIFIFKIYYNKI